MIDSRPKQPRNEPLLQNGYACMNEESGKMLINFQRKAELELARAREAEKIIRSYDSLLDVEEESSPHKSVREMMDDFM